MRTIILLLVLIAVGWWSLPWLKQHLPLQFNPFTPLAVTDPPGWMTRYKLKRLAGDPAACLDVMRRAQQAGLVTFSARPAVTGACPLPDPLRIQRFGSVSLSSSFLASCPMAVASTMFVLRSQQRLAQAQPGASLARINHVGSYACRNIYHRTEGRLSEHATADAWDVTGFQLADGQRIEVGKNWTQPESKSALLHQLWQEGCNNFGNALGPDYNAAHAGHFHFGMRGTGYCR
ncbi:MULTISPECIES: extensin family protein [Pantoea]|uniref:extensin-like domain-containing protein n=1 Tax=Pantoea TaxID=53335 RepID=UPI000661499A|nr:MULTISPECIES: extensin family protein [Pantoea]MBS6436901.1 extensin family protein [Pantoea sp.]MDU2728060.1 extensin family protein [Pantoea sp.]MDU5474238.1 extensin family protein [Pantoea sp.]